MIGSHTHTYIYIYIHQMHPFTTHHQPINNFTSHWQACWTWNGLLVGLAEAEGDVIDTQLPYMSHNLLVLMAASQKELGVISGDFTTKKCASKKKVELWNRFGLKWQSFSGTYTDLLSFASKREMGANLPAVNAGDHFFRDNIVSAKNKQKLMKRQMSSVPTRGSIQFSSYV